MGRVIGIDLGTTKAVVAVFENSRPRVIPNQEGGLGTPCVVAFTDKGETLVGEAARRGGLRNPSSTVYGVHRLIGRGFDAEEVRLRRRLVPYAVVEGPSGEARVAVDDRTYSPAEILALVLRKLKKAAEDHLEEKVDDAIVTVPAGFDYVRRQAIRDAARLADLRVPLVIDGSTAAALAYGLDHAQGQFVAVYDLGGGTFDITILELADGLFEVKATGGDTFLGGEDFDHRVVEWLVSEFRRETAIDLGGDRMALQRLKEAAEKAKCELSTLHQTDVTVPFIAADASGPKHLDVVLTRQMYESLTDDLLEKTEEPCRRCLADAQMRGEQIDEVLLVGGQTRAPKVAEVVRRVFGCDPNRSLPPDAAGALGAAVRAAIREGDVKHLCLLDVIGHTLGIETRDGTFTPILERCSPIPTRKSRVFTTAVDNQSRFEVHVLQGESDLAAYNRSLARFELTDLSPRPRAAVKIEVTIEVDVNGVASVGAVDLESGRHWYFVVRPDVPPGPAVPGRILAEAHPLPPSAPLADEGEGSFALGPAAAHDLGVEIGRGFFVAIVEKGTKLPARRSRLFTTMSEGQGRAVVHVLRHVRFRERYETLGRLAVTDIPAAPDGAPPLEVTFEIDALGTMSVSARAGTSGTSKIVIEAGEPGVPCPLSFTAPDGAEPEGLAPLPAPPAATREETMAGAGDAEQRERLEKARDEGRKRLDALVASILRLVQTFGSKLTPEELQDVLSAVEGAQHARKAGDFEVERVYLTELEKAAAALRQAMRRP